MNKLIRKKRRVNTSTLKKSSVAHNDEEEREALNMLLITKEASGFRKTLENGFEATIVEGDNIIKVDINHNKTIVGKAPDRVTVCKRYYSIKK